MRKTNPAHRNILAFAHKPFLYSPHHLFFTFTHHNPLNSMVFWISFSCLSRWSSREGEKERLGRRSFRVFFGSIAFLVFLGFLFVEILANGGTTKTTTTTTLRDNFKQFKAMGSDGPIFHAELDPKYYMSNRRVPNGPDPIHNRGAGKSKGPPGRAYP